MSTKSALDNRISTYTFLTIPYSLVKRYPHTINEQGETSLTAGIFGAFAIVLLDGRQPAFVVRRQNRSKIPGCRVQAVLAEQTGVQTMKRPQAILVYWQGL